jgi:hypothetical protein
MAKIYAIVHVGKHKLFVGDASQLTQRWRPILEQLNNGTHPIAPVQAAWNISGEHRHFTFHTETDLRAMPDLHGFQHLNGSDG